MVSKFKIYLITFKKRMSTQIKEQDIIADSQPIATQPTNQQQQPQTKTPTKPKPNSEKGEKNTDSHAYISDTNISMIRDEEEDLSPYLSVPMLNNRMKIIGNEALDKMVRWLASSSEVLKSNKLRTSYKLNTMTGENMQATGTVGSVTRQSSDTTGYSHKNTVNIKVNSGRLCAYSSTMLDKNVGFDVKHKRIDELLVSRLQDSLGKQSPENGKVWDLRSILNANMLPVVKNGAITRTHRILETSALLANNASLPTDSHYLSAVVEYFDERDLCDNWSRQRLSNLRTSGYTTTNYNYVIKGIANKDIVREVRALIYGTSIFVNAINSSTYPTQRINIYGPSVEDLSSLVDDYYFDYAACFRPENRPRDVKTVPLPILCNGTPAGKIVIHTERSSTFEDTFKTITLTDTTQRDILADYIQSKLSDREYDDIETLLSGTSLIIGTGDDAVTINYTVATGYNTQASNAVTNSTLKSKIRVTNYIGMENFADIINAIDLLAQLSAANRTDGASASVDPHPLLRIKGTNKFYRFLSQSSIWARIAMYYGQLEYVHDEQYPLGNEALITNKIYNYAYYLSGSLCEFVSRTFGSFDTLNRYIDYPTKQYLIGSDRVLNYKSDGFEYAIPLLNLPFFMDNVEWQEQYGVSTSNLNFVSYYTLSDWWRYDYFGGLHSEVPKQRISANQDDEDYNQHSGMLFTDTSTGAGTTIGSCSIRFTPNSNYVNLTIKSVTACDNTASLIIIPKIFTSPKLCSTMHLRGLSLSTTSDPIWYGPYYPHRDLIDPGNWNSVIMDALF